MQLGLPTTYRERIIVLHFLFCLPDSHHLCENKKHLWTAQPSRRGLLTFLLEQFVIVGLSVFSGKSVQHSS